MHRCPSPCTSVLRSTFPRHPPSPQVRHRSFGTKPVQPTDAKRVARNVVRGATRPLRHQHFPENFEKTPLQTELRLVNTILDALPWPSTAPQDPLREGTPYGPEEEDEGVSRITVKRGSLIQVRRSGNVYMAVLLDAKDTGKGSRIHALSNMGRICVNMKEDIVFALPDFIDAGHVARIGLQDAPLTEKELMARVAATKKMQDFARTQEIAYNRHIHFFTNFHDRVRSPDPEKWAKISVADAIKMTGESPCNSAFLHLAVQDHLMARPHEFIAHPSSYLTAQFFHVRPRSQVDRINAVVDMVRNNDKRLKEFAIRARHTILELRKRSTTGHGPPSSTPAPDLAFNDVDHLIIRFMVDAFQQMRSFQVDPYATLVCSFIKSVDLYDGVVDPDQHLQFLRDLGVLAPWQDTTSLRWDLHEMVEEPATESSAAPTKPVKRGSSDAYLSPDEFYPSDRLESVRHDFGDLPVYVVDDFGAKELDDGISVESIPSEPDNLWLHVHIADPTALLHPNHVSVRRAARLNQTIYFPNLFMPMLPDSVMQASLGSGGGQPERVLTFSAKIDPQGEIMEHKVRAGIVRNLRLLKYDEVDHAMSFDPPASFHPFGAPPPHPMPTDLLPAADLDNFHLLQTIASRAVARRLRHPTFLWTAPSAKVTLSPSSLPSTPGVSSHPSLYQGFPDMTYTATVLLEGSQGSRRIVAECAVIAGMVASRFGLERGLPLVRRCLQDPVGLEDISDILATRDENGVVDSVRVHQSQMVIPKVTSSLEAGGHWQLAIPSGVGYTRATSPMRRYPDLVTHWQIKHALLNPSAPPLISAEKMQAVAVDADARELIHKRTGRLHEKEWAFMYIKRWMQRRDDGIEGPDPFQNLVGRVVGLQTTNMVLNVHAQDIELPTLGLTGTLVRNFGSKELPLGEQVAVKLDKISTALRPIIIVNER
ncbi:hypothetical protein OF83DRAFT_1240972 [Amylostereum chailletii]|nr:hypothetical protein OF83DRAFT_1240972 [Amylostereum chailletii]